MVGGALAHVQGSSPKANATLLSKVNSVPRPPGSRKMTEQINETFKKFEEQIRVLEETVDKLQSIIDAGISIKAQDNRIVVEFNRLANKPD